jgi:hypothetical protein
MMQALSIAPVASAVDANDFEYYSSGSGFSILPL